MSATQTEPATPAAQPSRGGTEPGEAGGSRIPRIAAVLCLLGVVAIAAILLFSGGGSDYRYRLVFENAGQLVLGNQVQIGGHPVGSIDGIHLTDDGNAAIDISMEQQLHEGSKAVIRATSLAGVANRYISIAPGLNSAPALPDGSTIGRGDTASPVDLDQVLNSFTPRTRNGLSNFIKGQAEVYAGKGPQANRSYKYLQPALWTTKEVLAQINKDQYNFERFITGSARLFTALAGRSDDLESSIVNANQAFGAIAAENQALDETLQRLPTTFRRSNTTFVNLRAALDDLDSLVDTAKPATEDLTPFLKNARPVVRDSVPFFRNFKLALSSPGPANDLGELTAILPRVGGDAHTSFKHARTALEDFQPTLEFARPYSTEMVQGLAKLGQASAYYDADGHYFRAMVANLNIFDYDEGTGQLEPAPAADQFAPYGATRITERCPGGVVQSAPDNSNPFYDPPWPGSGLTGGECNPGDIPPGP